MWGLNSREPEIMTGGKIKSQTLNLLSHPGAPRAACTLSFYYNGSWRVGIIKVDKSRDKETGAHKDYMLQLGGSGPDSETFS